MKYILLIPLLLIIAGCVTTLSFGLHNSFPGDKVNTDINITFTDKD